jgi:hypothetical protein
VKRIYWLRDSLSSSGVNNSRKGNRAKEPVIGNENGLAADLVIAEFLNHVGTKKRQSVTRLETVNPPYPRLGSVHLLSSHVIQ